MTEPPSLDDLRAWLIRRLALHLGFPEPEVDPESLLADIGLDSLSALAVFGEIEAAFGVELDPVLLSEDITVAGLAGHIARHAADVRASSTTHGARDHSGPNSQSPGDSS